ncbi:unnamed protein product [Arabis nemorensis]|uniref:F-box domain-containing protein n=1 Tax=Arabis nemorensis TaxID=586526 RepID=A0A565BME7_9BRAS|nr:unnamed protein product [Arabis nemorensis]
MGKPVRWSDLPKELVDLIADRSSYIDHLRIRSICKPWRYAVATKKRFFNRFKRSLVGSSNSSRRKKSDLLPNTFFRVTQASSSCPNKGWLIKTRQISESSKINLLSPLSNELITRSDKTLDLLKFGVSDIRQSYNVQFLKSKIWCNTIVEESFKWTRIENKNVGEFSDVILHRGQVYALDLKGVIWRVNNNLDDLNISQYGPSTPVKYRKTNNCKDKRLVEYCGDLCVVHRLCQKVHMRTDFERTIGFKVYKMDNELAEWVEVSSLEDKALIVATDSCFTVLASEYYGCLENAIYFSDDEDGYKFRKGVNGKGAKVLKLNDGRIINNTSHNCFQMFSSPFLSKY